MSGIGPDSPPGLSQPGGFWNAFQNASPGRTAEESRFGIVLQVGTDPIVISSGGPLAVKRPSATTEVVDLEKKAILGSLGYSYENGPMAISADDRFMCVGTEEFAGLPHHISVWDLAERKRVSVLPIPEGSGRGDVVQFSGDGKRIAFGRDARFCIWEKTAPPKK